jgi:hypothetical protein
MVSALPDAGAKAAHVAQPVQIGLEVESAIPPCAGEAVQSGEDDSAASEGRPFGAQRGQAAGFMSASES